MSKPRKKNRFVLSVQEMEALCKRREKDINSYHKEYRNAYRAWLTPDEEKWLIEYRDNNVVVHEPKVVEKRVVTDPLLQKFGLLFTEEEVQTLIDRKENQIPISKFEINVGLNNDESKNVGILLASDWHIDETVKAETVLGKNEFNKEIAEKRIKTYFKNAVDTIKTKKCDELILGVLGDMIGGYIHEELAQTNHSTPMQGIQMVKSALVSGIKYLYNELNIPITVVAVSGNHSRSTRKKQFANGFAMSHEYFMYEDIKQIIELMGLPIKFIIPQSELAYINVLGKNLLFCHGDQFKSCGGVGGIYPPMLRWFGKMNQTIPIDRAFIGHYHTSITDSRVTVCGSLKGYDAFAMGHALPFEPPQQAFVILNEKRGFIFNTPIFCD